MSQFRFKVLPIALGIAAMSCGTAITFAADSPAPKSVASPVTSGIEEVIVTARKSEESVQVVPVSVAALSPDTLTKQAVLSVADLKSSVPGLMVGTNSQGAAATFGIRAAKEDNGTSTTVTAYIGDMPVTTTRAIATMMYDMQSISVLKGPQGTLFGANSTGGAIIFRPNTPIDAFEGYAELGVGNFGRQSFQGMINLPVSDTVQMRLAAEMVDRDQGFQKNRTPVNGNADMGTDKHESARFTLRIKPNAAFQNDLMLSYFHEDDQPQQEALIATRSSPFTVGAVSINWVNAGVFPTTDPRKVSTGGSPTWQKAKITDIVDTLTYDISDTASFKVVLGYEKAEVDTFQDNDATPFPVVNGRTVHNFEQLTFEPSLDLKSSDGRLRNKTGLFISNLQKDIGNSYSVQGWPTRTATQSNAYYWREYKSHAIYNQISYDLTKELTATLGLRYTWDKADYKATNRLGFALNTATGVTAVGGAIQGNFFSGLCSAPPLLPVGLTAYQNFNAAACTGEKSIKSQAPSFSFTLEDKFAERAMVYATLRGGYLVGGFNNQIFSPNGFAQTYEPEKVVDIETGVKADWDLWGRPIRTNLAVFYGNYKDQQRTQNGQSNGLTFRAAQNAGASTFYGLDLDVTYEVTDNLELKAAWNHLETEYTKYVAALNIPNVVASIDLSGTSMSQAPKDQVNLSATMKWPLASSVGNVSSTLSWYWTDKTQMIDSPTFSCTPDAAGLCSSPSSAALDFRQYDMIQAYDIWNFTTEWKNIMGSNFDANFWVKNLTDKKYRTYISNQMLQFGYVSAYHGAPRTMGVNVRYNF